MPYDIIALAGRGEGVAGLAFNLDEDETEEGLKDVEHAVNSGLKGEVLGDLLLVDGVLLLDHQAVVEAVVP